MQGLIDSAVHWCATLAGGDVVALILLFVAVAFAFTAVKSVLKLAGGVIGFLALLYLIDPGLYGSLSGILDSVISTAESISWNTLLYGT